MEDRSMHSKGQVIVPEAILQDLKWWWRNARQQVEVEIEALPCTQRSRQSQLGQIHHPVEAAKTALGL